jgi:hypothetical protein
MPSVNPLLGSAATPEVAAGYAAGMTDAGVYDAGGASRDIDDSASGTNLKVAAILGAAVLFVVLLRKGGFRDMVTV